MKKSALWSNYKEQKRGENYYEKKHKEVASPVLFTLGGALTGFMYYTLVGCSTGTCAITSNPFTSMAYMGLMGWLLSGILGTGCKGTCNT